MKPFAAMFAAAVVLAVISMIVKSAEAGTSSVDIINNSVGEPLWVHCKSGDDDLQWQLLQIGQDYHFEFHENIIMNTVFWCRFVWGPNGRNWQAFTVWDRAHPWDMPLPCGNCGWKAQTQGMFIWDKWHQRYNLWKVWNTNGPTTFASETNPPGAWGMSALGASHREGD